MLLNFVHCLVSETKGNIVGAEYICEPLGETLGTQSAPQSVTEEPFSVSID